MKNILFFVLIFSLINAQQGKNIQEKENKFLEIKVENSALQSEIDLLRSEFTAELDEIKRKHKLEKKSLRKIYRQRLKVLRKKYKNPESSKGRKKAKKIKDSF